MPAKLLLSLPRTGKAWEPEIKDDAFKVEKRTEGVRLSYFRQEATFMNINYSVKNDTANAIRNIDYVLIFRDHGSGDVINYIEYVDPETISPGMAKLQNKMILGLSNFFIVNDEHRDETKDYLRKSKVDVNMEFRVLSYDIVDVEKNSISN